jgi:hypothetical protein
VPKVSRLKPLYQVFNRKNSEVRGAHFIEAPSNAGPNQSLRPGFVAASAQGSPICIRTPYEKLSPSPTTAGHEVRCLEEWTILDFITVAAVASDQEIKSLHASLHALCEVCLAIEGYPGFGLSAQLIFRRLPGSPRSDVPRILYGLCYCMITDYIWLCLYCNCALSLLLLVTMSYPWTCLRW